MASTFGLLGLMLGIDSLVVGLGVGAAAPRMRRSPLVLAFALCDGMASWLGWAAGAAAWRHVLEGYTWLGPAAVGAYGLYVLGLAWHSRRLAESDAGAWLVLGLPLCLSLDNLAAGVGMEAGWGWAVVGALAIGLSSGCLAFAGLWMGATLRSRVRIGAEWLGGTALVVVALVLVCMDVLS